MNKERAKFLLNAYRPHHQDRDAAEFCQALASAEGDPELKEWFETQLEFDRTMIRVLESIPVPVDLRDSILLGAGAGGRGVRLRSWLRPAVLAAAALLIAGIFLGVGLNLREGGEEELSAWKRAAVTAVDELENGIITLDLASSDPQTIRSWLLERWRLPEDSASPELAGVETVGCKQVRSGDGIVTIFCFRHDRRLYHLASYQMDEEMATRADAEPAIKRTGEWLAATWTEGEIAHMLLTVADGAEPKAVLDAVRSLRA